MPSKLTFIFSRGRHGWSESWYRLPSVVDLEQEMQAALAIAKARVQLLSGSASLDAIRVQDVGQLGSGYLRREPELKLASLYEGNPHADQKKAAILCRAEADLTTYKRSFMLRGCPDDFLFFDLNKATEELDDGFNKSLKKFFAALQDNAAGLRVLSKNVPPGSAPERKILDIFSTVAGGKVIFNVPGHGYTQQQQVRVRRAKFIGDGPAVNGVWEVRLDQLGVIDPIDNFWVVTTAPDPHDFRYWANGVVQARNVVYRLVDSLAFERLSQRDTGSAFFRGRGRSRAFKLP